MAETVGAAAAHAAADVDASAFQSHQKTSQSRHAQEAEAGGYRSSAAAAPRTDAGAHAAAQDARLTSLASVTASSQTPAKAAKSSTDSWAAALACSGAAESEAATSRCCSDENAPALGCASVVGSPPRARERRVFQSSGEALRSLSMPAQGGYAPSRAC